MEGSRGPFMLAILGGSLALLLGLLLLLLPLLVSELSRSRDSVWGAVVLILGLVLVTSADRFTGAPMLGVLCGGLLIGRLGLEVGQGRWRALSDGERQQLGSAERWQRSINQLLASLASLLQTLKQSASGLLAWWQERQRKPSTGKRWVRADEESPAASPVAVNPTPPDPSATAGSGLDEPGQSRPPEPTKDSTGAEPTFGTAPAEPRGPGVLEVEDFSAIEALLERAPAEEPPQSAAVRSDPAPPQTPLPGSGNPDATTDPEPAPDGITGAGSAAPTFNQAADALAANGSAAGEAG